MIESSIGPVEVGMMIALATARRLETEVGTVYISGSSPS